MTTRNFKGLPPTRGLATRKPGRRWGRGLSNSFSTGGYYSTGPPFPMPGRVSSFSPGQNCLIIIDRCRLRNPAHFVSGCYVDFKFDLSYRRHMNTLSKILRDNRFQPADVPRFESKLFYEGARSRPYLERFFVLLILATIISTAGIISDSTATVIGAMIVAPLMTPIMATAAALVMGNMPRAVNRFSLVLVGVVTVVLLAALLSTLYSGIIVFESNSQIIARISPRLIDLVAALASGAAGAFCLSREDIADSLPGVAIAISLVPPLCVTGTALAAGEWAAAQGSLLLFITNLLAILLAGGAVLAFLGLNHAAMIEIRGTARRNAFALIILAVVVVAIPLVLTGRKVTQDFVTEFQTRQAAQAWVAGSGFHVRLVQVTDDSVYIAVAGDGSLPAFSELVTAVETAVGHTVRISLEVLPAQLLSNTPAGP